MASAAVKVGVDLGDVMSTRDPGGAKQEGDDLYKAVTPGFFAFALLFGMAHGLENLYIVSRTHSGKWYSYHKKYGHVEAWTVRFVRQTGLVEMGMPLNHLHLCERKSGEKGKGAIASKLGLTHHIDNDIECLWSMVHDVDNTYANILQEKGFLVMFTELKPEMNAKWMTDRLRQCMCEAGSWQEVARLFELPHVDDPGVWDWLDCQGPPHRQYSGTTVERVRQELDEWLASYTWGPPPMTPWRERDDDDDDDDDDYEYEEWRRQEAHRLFTQYREIRQAQREKLRQQEEAEERAEQVRQLRLQEAAERAEQVRQLRLQEEAEERAEQLRQHEERIAALRAEEDRLRTTQVRLRQQVQASDALRQREEQDATLRNSFRALEAQVQGMAEALARREGDKKPWSTWASNERNNDGWNYKKYKRAMNHAAGIRPSPACVRRVVTPMCASCHINQPGVYCPYSLCSPCCQSASWAERASSSSANANECWQHAS